MLKQIRFANETKEAEKEEQLGDTEENIDENTLNLVVELEKQPQKVDATNQAGFFG